MHDHENPEVLLYQLPKPTPEGRTVLTPTPLELPRLWPRFAHGHYPGSMNRTRNCTATVAVMASAGKRGRTLVVAALSLLASGCSGVRLVYPSLDWTLPLYVESRIALEGSQRNRLRSHVEALLAWHCADQLHRYADWLTAVAEDVAAGPLSRSQLERHAEALDAFRHDLAQAVAPRAADLLFDLSQAQVAELKARFEESNAEFREAYVDPSPGEVRNRLAEDMVERLERWLGPLTPAQRARVAAWGESVQPGQAERVAIRERWQRALVRAADQRALRADVEQEVDTLLRYPERLWTSTYRTQFEAVRTSVLALLEDLGSTLSAAQRQHLTERLAGWSSDFEALACVARQPGARDSSHETRGHGDRGEPLGLSPGEGERGGPGKPIVVFGPAARIDPRLASTRGERTVPHVIQAQADPRCRRGGPAGCPAIGG